MERQVCLSGCLRAYGSNPNNPTAPAAEPRRRKRLAAAAVRWPGPAIARGVRHPLLVGRYCTNGLSAAPLPHSPFHGQLAPQEDQVVHVLRRQARILVPQERHDGEAGAAAGAVSRNLRR